MRSISEPWLINAYSRRFPDLSLHEAVADPLQVVDRANNQNWQNPLMLVDILTALPRIEIDKQTSSLEGRNLVPDDQACLLQSQSYNSSEVLSSLACLSQRTISEILFKSCN